MNPARKSEASRSRNGPSSQTNDYKATGKGNGERDQDEKQSSTSAEDLHKTQRDGQFRKKETRREINERLSRQPDKVYDNRQLLVDKSKKMEINT